VQPSKVAGLAPVCCRITAKSFAGNRLQEIQSKGQNFFLSDNSDPPFEGKSPPDLQYLCGLIRAGVGRPLVSVQASLVPTGKQFWYKFQFCATRPLRAATTVSLKKIAVRTVARDAGVRLAAIWYRVGGAIANRHSAPVVVVYHHTWC
jgi:hypothetical protein